ncbi:hypothetical protein [Bradyrhizobium sp. BR 10261]|uniref:hypothetical protein n=1 Tax=Bradyrhizobium sp. BR 10261 TaxID=2749992 RepID=UPI001C6539EC|nr:hypothetical protein [Bradyrhizobium sp. BR 10261]MBW7963948.1 hypothetical protein [Bradyrhizobium sp. BR 10261]
MVGLLAKRKARDALADYDESCAGLQTGKWKTGSYSEVVGRVGAPWRNRTDRDEFGHHSLGVMAGLDPAIHD